MQQLISSTTFSAGVMAGLLAIGIAGHQSAGTNVQWSGLLNGSTQALYETQFEANSAAQDLAVNAVGAVKYAIFGQASEGAIVGDDGWLFTSEELDVSPAFEENLAISAQRIADVAKVLERRGVALLPVIVPDKAEIYAAHLGVKRPDATVGRRQALVALLGEAGLDPLDAAMPLRAAMGAQPVFMKDDTHWSPAGSRAVAQAIGLRLQSAQIARTEVRTQETGHRAFDGDLLQYVPTGNLRAWVGPEQQYIRTFETQVQSTVGLFGDAPVDVALVGTSFSAKPDWHFEGFLKHALQADVVNFAEEGKGPFAPMEAFLASDFLTSTPPQVVIWEIPVRYVSKEQ